MNMQQMVIQMQKVQRQLQKAQDELAKKEFKITKAGLVTVKVLGSKEIISINIEEDGFDKDNKEMVEEMIALALNELFEQIDAENEAIQEQIAGKSGMMF